MRQILLISALTIGGILACTTQSPTSPEAPSEDSFVPTEHIPPTEGPGNGETNGPNTGPSSPEPGSPSLEGAGITRAGSGEVRAHVVNRTNSDRDVSLAVYRFVTAGGAVQERIRVVNRTVSASSGQTLITNYPDTCGTRYQADLCDGECPETLPDGVVPNLLKGPQRNSMQWESSLVCTPPPPPPPPVCDVPELKSQARQQCEHGFTIDERACTFECKPPPRS